MMRIKTTFLTVPAFLLITFLYLSPVHPQNWPSFRGQSANGVADNQNLPSSWDAESGKNIKWKIALPGLAHSSPIVWQDYLFVTTAVSSAGDDSFKPGLYGSGDASGDQSAHEWRVIAINKKTGEIRWERTAYHGNPIEKRHIKATYANSTPVTNGKYVVAFFGSQGLYNYDFQGKLIWKKELGHLDVGAFDAPEYEWGTASSPIIYQDKVILQVDTQNEDFVTAFDIETGETVWKTDRDELPSWGTPTIFPGKDRVELITNASNFIRGYNPDNGEELWRLGGSSQITAPTPIFNDDLIVVVSGRGPERPIFVIRPGAKGDITLPEGKTSSPEIAWSLQGRGSYMPTPIIYGNHLYVLQNQGILDCYELLIGTEVYRNRIPHRGSGFSGSPVASDGILYLPGEDGDIFAVQAGPDFKVLSRNPIGENLMSTPAISDGMMYIRGHHHLFAVGK
jgi:outer membrane protein assembly factor BamB